MTDVVDRPVQASSEAEPSARSQQVSTVATQLIRLMRASNKARARFLSQVGDAERSAHLILRLLQNEGPLRASAVAEHLDSDPSTVSRQVAALAKDGLLERQADPADGRASLLVLTSRASDLLARHDELRNQHFAALLAGWSDEELTAFVAALTRFSDDYLAATAAAPLPAAWPTSRPPAPPDRTRTTTLESDR